MPQVRRNEVTKAYQRWQRLRSQRRRMVPGRLLKQEREVMDTKFAAGDRVEYYEEGDLVIGTVISTHQRGGTIWYKIMSILDVIDYVVEEDLDGHHVAV